MAIRLLGISGSIRSASSCASVIRGIQTALQGQNAFEVFPLNDIPLYSQDLDGELTPTPVRDLRASIALADGLVICTPEYNHGVSGVLKNAPRLGLETPWAISVAREARADHERITRVHRWGQGPVPAY